jgi:hypothetical protein
MIREFRSGENIFCIKNIRWFFLFLCKMWTIKANNIVL